MDTTHPARQHQLEELALQMAMRGWIVRLELDAPLPDVQQCLVVRRPHGDQAYLLAVLARHLIQVWTAAAPIHSQLGTAADVDDVQELLRPPAGVRHLPPTQTCGPADTRDSRRHPPCDRSGCPRGGPAIWAPIPPTHQQHAAEGRRP